jgi:hypothetical protein
MVAGVPKGRLDAMGVGREVCVCRPRRSRGEPEGKNRCDTAIVIEQEHWSG